MNFLDRLSENCGRLGEKVALEFVGEDGAVEMVVGYGELEEMVQRTMGMLQGKGVQVGDRVAMQLPKCLPFIYVHLAVMRLEAISLPLNPGYPVRELGYFLGDAEASLFFADAAALETLEPSLDEFSSLKETIFLDVTTMDDFETLLSEYPNPQSEIQNPKSDSTAMMIYTSGTTGRPKGAMITQANMTAQIDALHEAWGWREEDVILHVLPIFHVHGLTVALHGALNAGATAVMLPKFEAELAVKLMQERPCSVFMAVPTIHRKMLDYADGRKIDLSHMRLMTSGSDRLPDNVFTAYEETFGQTLLERYGMSETGMNLSNPLEGERRVGSVGMSLPGVEARIVNPATEDVLPDGEVGEVHIRGPHVCKGYWRQPEKTAEAFTADGWLRTGDMGVRAADGYFTLKGRSKDLIISGGYNIYPPEVELVLAGHPAVSGSAVIGCPNETWGETVVAVIVVHEGAQVTEEDILAHCQEGLIKYKVPRRVIFVDEFPRNALGKIQKAKLREGVCG